MKDVKFLNFNIAKNLKYDGYQRGLVLTVYTLFDKKPAGNSVNTHGNNECPLDLAMLKLAEELHRPIIKKLKKGTVYSGFKNKIGVLMHLICN